MLEILMMKGAQKLIEKCANVQAGERVLIVTDFELQKLAEVLATAAKSKPPCTTTS
jgi:leucyl aminopeptidase (aminopeptidase T)